MWTLLFWLIVGHFVADFPLQSDPMARGKAMFKEPLFGVPWYLWLTAHCAVHAGAVMLATGRIELALAECAAHFGIDCLKSAKITGIHTDQALHIACKVMWVAIVYAGATP